MGVDMAEVLSGARAAGFPIDGMAHAQDASADITDISVRINHGAPVPTLADTEAGGLAEGRYNDCWLFLRVYRGTYQGRPYYHVNSICTDSERREDAPGGGRKGAEGPDLARAVEEAIRKQGFNADGKLQPCWDARAGRDARRREREAQAAVPVGVPWTARDQQLAEEGEAEAAAAGSPLIRVLLAGAIIFVVLALAGVSAVAHLGPFSQASSRSANSPGQAAAARPFGTTLNGASAELQFAGFVMGDCPPQDQKYIGQSFTGGWKTSVGTGGGSNQSVNMLGLASSPFAVALNGDLNPAGVLDVSGDGNVEFMHLRLVIPMPPPGPLSAPLSVTGKADVKLHFIGSPAIGTVTGDCGATYGQVTGTFAPPA